MFMGQVGGLGLGQAAACVRWELANCNRTLRSRADASATVPNSVKALASWIVTGSNWPINRRWPSNTTIRSQSVRPANCTASRRRHACFGRSCSALRPGSPPARPTKRLVVFLADRVLQGQQLVVPPPLDLLRHVVGVELGGLGARPRAVLEDEAVLEPRLADQLDRLLEIVLRLAAKADDEVAGHRRRGNVCADPGEHLAIFFDRVAALHPLAGRGSSRSGPARADRARPWADRAPPAAGRRSCAADNW